MRLLLLIGGVLAVLVAATATPARAIPNGKGLERDFPINCPQYGGDILITITPGGGGPGYTPDGHQLLVQTFVGTFTFTSPEGEVTTITETRTSGVKAGLEPASRCTTHLEETLPDGTLLEIDLDLIVVEVK